MIIKKIIQCRIFVLLLLMVTFSMITFPSPASAALGDDVATVQTDLSRMKGALRTSDSGPYTIHEITMPTGTVVKEYVSTAGKVFAVTWQGPLLPDLRQLLGSHFEKFSQAVKTQKRNHPGRRGPLLIQEPGLVVKTGGRMRAYIGRAYVPELVPQGVSIEELQ
ncbi:MAG: DUF2844 domain-containing protein [Syntrophaceae bacterium]